MSFRIIRDVKADTVKATESMVPPQTTNQYSIEDGITTTSTGDVLIGTQTAILSEDNFSVFNTGPGGNFGYFSFPPFVPQANDATVVAGPNGLEINPTPQSFTATVGQNPFGLLDHVKFLVYRADGNSPVAGASYSAFIAPDDGSELVYECIDYASDQYFPNPIPAAIAGGVLDKYRDPRLACSCCAVLDPDNFFTFDCIATRDGYYAIYEFLPFLKPGWPFAPPSYDSYNPPVNGDYHAFTHIIPLGGRDSSVAPLDDKANIKVCYNKQKGYVRWLINDSEKFRVENIGAALDPRYKVIDHNGPDIKVVPNRLCFGFNLFTLLDAHEPSAKNLDDLALVQLTDVPTQYVNPRSDRTWPGGIPVYDSTFLDPTSATANRLFGQGAQARVGGSKVYIRKIISS